MTKKYVYKNTFWKCVGSIIETIDDFLTSGDDYFASSSVMFKGKGTSISDYFISKGIKVKIN